MIAQTWATTPTARGARIEMPWLCITLLPTTLLKLLTCLVPGEVKRIDHRSMVNVAVRKTSERESKVFGCGPEDVYARKPCSEECLLCLSLIACERHPASAGRVRATPKGERRFPAWLLLSRGSTIQLYSPIVWTCCGSIL
jgi:hypothetical protein